MTRTRISKQKLRFDTLFFQTQKRPDKVRTLLCLVESEGIEPSSKQATHRLSTCLVCVCFSTLNCPQTGDSKLSFSNFGINPKPIDTYTYFYEAPEPNAVSQGFRGTSCLPTLSERGAILTVIQD